MSSKDQVRKTYDTWYSNNRADISQNKWKLVDQSLLDHPEKDSQRGINLLTFVPENISNAIDQKLLSQLKKTLGNIGWVIPAGGRHVTILDILPHNSGIDETALDSLATSYSETISTVLRKFRKKVFITFEGIFASPDGITIQGYPSESLSSLRSILRKELSSKGLANVETKKYKIETAHMAFTKFTSPLDGEKVLEVIDELRIIPLGTFKVSELVLSISPRYDKTKSIEVLDKFSL